MSLKVLCSKKIVMVSLTVHVGQRMSSFNKWKIKLRGVKKTFESKRIKCLKRKTLCFFHFFHPKAVGYLMLQLGGKKGGWGRGGGRRGAGERERESSSSVCNQVMRMRMWRNSCCQMSLTSSHKICTVHRVSRRLRRHDSRRNDARPNGWVTFARSDVCANDICAKWIFSGS